MIRIIIDIEDYGDKLATKEAVAMALTEMFTIDNGSHGERKDDGDG